MSNNPMQEERGVERREEQRLIEEPGYVVSERVTHDLAAERRLRFYRVSQIVWTLLGILEVFLGLRFGLKLIGANPEAGFANLIYGVTEPFVAPFGGLVGTPQFNNLIFETTTLIGMAVYALFTWILVRLLYLVADRTSARTVVRSVREEFPQDDDLGDAHHEERRTRTVRRE
jgi:YggT family protein